MESQQTRLFNSVGLLVLRLGIGGFMLTHGWGKAQRVLGGEFDTFGDPIGLGSAASLVLVTLAEFVCAGLVVLGLATRFAAAPVVIAMAVAAMIAHGADPWTMGGAAELFQAGETQYPSSKEPALLYLIGFLTLVFTGPGRFSLDALVWPRLWKNRKNQPKTAE